LKIGILTRNLITDYKAQVSAIPCDYLEIVKQNAYPIFIDSTLSLSVHKNELLEQIKDLSGFILPGGDMVSEIDLFIIDYCFKHDIPLLGICLGMQEIGFYFDNKIISKLSNDSHFDMDKPYIHSIYLTPNGHLCNLLNLNKINVNSRHHYHINENDNFFIEAKCNDVIEAIKVKNKKYILGLQFHPELMYSFDNNAKLIFQDFFRICKSNKS